jgi:hypothetical protein
VNPFSSTPRTSLVTSAAPVHERTTGLAEHPRWGILQHDPLWLPVNKTRSGRSCTSRAWDGLTRVPWLCDRAPNHDDDHAAHKHGSEIQLARWPREDHQP